MNDLGRTGGARCDCGSEVRRHWRHCPQCGLAQVWRHLPTHGGPHCGQCGWAVSQRDLFCPWCRASLPGAASGAQDGPRGAGVAPEQACDWGCGGRVMYPMAWCPSCGRDQGWPDDEFEGTCPHCRRGADDWMTCCPWCGRDPSGGDLIGPALRRVDEALAASRIRPWGYRVLLRPGISGVDPDYPKIVEIEQTHVVGRSPGRIDWAMLVGLIVHELGHSFLYHHLAWARTDRFRRAFGDVDAPYDVPDDAPVAFHHGRVSRFPVSFVTAYAAFHPQEDFAETFRLYVFRRASLDVLFGELDGKGKAGVIRERFELLHQYLRSLPGDSA